jgi:hypothetical protein
MPVGRDCFNTVFLLLAAVLMLAAAIMASGAALSGDVSLLNSLANVDLTQHDELTLEQKDMLSVVLSQVTSKQLA